MFYPQQRAAGVFLKPPCSPLYPRDVDNLYCLAWRFGGVNAAASVNWATIIHLLGAQGHACCRQLGLVSPGPRRRPVNGFLRQYCGLGGRLRVADRSWLSWGLRPPRVEGACLRLPDGRLLTIYIGIQCQVILIWRDLIACWSALSFKRMYRPTFLFYWDGMKGNLDVEIGCQKSLCP